MKTKDLYDENASKWLRLEASSLSDFTARELVFELCGKDLSDTCVLDLGCGEGYCSRVLASKGAKHCTAIDLSCEMIQIAKQRNEIDGYPIDFFAASVVNYQAERSYELVLAIFLFNYLSVSDMCKVMRMVWRSLKPGGKFIFTVPHPFFPFVYDLKQPPFFFDNQGKDYFSSVNSLFQGEILKSDGVALPVQCVHKKFDDYFSSLSEAGFESLPVVKELTLNDNIPAHLYESARVLENIPLHVLFLVNK